MILITSHLKIFQIVWIFLKRLPNCTPLTSECRLFCAKQLLGEAEAWRFFVSHGDSSWCCGFYEKRTMVITSFFRIHYCYTESYGNFFDCSPNHIYPRKARGHGTNNEPWDLHLQNLRQMSRNVEIPTKVFRFIGTPFGFVSALFCGPSSWWARYLASRCRKAFHCVESNLEEFQSLVMEYNEVKSCGITTLIITPSIVPDR